VNSLQDAARETDRREQYLPLAALVLLSVIYLFSPFASYIGSLLFLTVFSRRLSTRMRIAASVIAILSGASIWASRLVGRTESDDFEWYYAIYRPVDPVPWTNKIPVYEVGFPLLIKIISVALPGLTPSGLIFVLTTVTGLILLFGVERFGLREFSKEKRGYCNAMVFLFFSFVLTTQLTRQMLSSVFLVIAFLSPKAMPRRLSLLLASAFHLSAIGVYAVIRMFQSKYLWIPFLLFWVVLITNVVDVYAMASLVTGQIPRLDYFYLMAGDSAANLATLAIVLAVTLPGAMSLVGLKAAEARISAQEKRIMLLLALVILAYFLTLNFTLGPFRVFLVIHAVLAGWFFAFLTRRWSSPWLVVGSVVLILMRAWSLFFVDPDRTFLPWEVYGPFGAFPGYFIFSYLGS